MKSVGEERGDGASVPPPPLASSPRSRHTDAMAGRHSWIEETPTLFFVERTAQRMATAKTTT
jgi:hypothetical protein